MAGECTCVITGELDVTEAIQVHHTVADGFHTARAVQELQEFFLESLWLSVYATPRCAPTQNREPVPLIQQLLFGL